jgi:hypothetical protein
VKRAVPVLAAFVLAVGLFVILPSDGPTGDYHNGQTLVCSDCHTMHYSQSHAYDSGNPALNPPGPNGPFGSLLRAGGSALCLSCHDGKPIAPDVLGEHNNGYVRQAGALTTGAAPYENWKGHTIGESAVPPGGAMIIALQCTNCHAQHGSPNYRNLGGVVSLVTYAKGVNDTRKDIFVRKYYGDGVSTMAERYSPDNIDFNEPNVTLSAMAKFCKGCHTDFHGARRDSNMTDNNNVWIRHPSADANIGAGNSSLDTFKNKLFRVKVMSSLGIWGTQGQAWAAPPNDLTPTCISCHRAHGNKNPFGLIYATGNAAITEEGDGTGVRDLCRQCHDQGS